MRASDKYYIATIGEERIGMYSGIEIYRAGKLKNKKLKKCGGSETQIKALQYARHIVHEITGKVPTKEQISKLSRYKNETLSIQNILEDKVPPFRYQDPIDPNDSFIIIEEDE